MRYTLTYENEKDVNKVLNLKLLIMTYLPIDETGEDRYDYVHIFRRYYYNNGIDFLSNIILINI